VEAIRQHQRPIPVAHQPAWSTEESPESIATISEGIAPIISTSPAVLPERAGDSADPPSLPVDHPHHLGSGIREEQVATRIKPQELRKGEPHRGRGDASSEGGSSSRDLASDHRGGGAMVDLPDDIAAVVCHEEIAIAVSMQAIWILQFQL
jgi:hypothetical protein